MDLGLSDRVALVTGGTRGIGRATALALGRGGARVAVAYRRDRERAESVVHELRAAGHDAMSVRHDLGSSETATEAVEAVVGRWGRIDILVNCAVRWPLKASALFESVPAEEWADVLHANVDGALAAIDAAVPWMRRNGWGRIVSVSSTMAADGLPGFAAYASAKAALLGLTESLARELGRDGILANVVLPGLVVTEQGFLSAEVQDRMAGGGSIRSLLRPDEVAATIAFLCSAQNAAITGAAIRASGSS